MNIYERAESMVEIDEMRYWFENGHFKGGSPLLLTSTIYKTGHGRNLNEHDKEVIWLQFLTKIQTIYNPTGPITYDPSLDLYKLSLLELQILLYCLQLNHTMPINMKGVYTYNTRVWRTDPILELVITKVEPDYGYAKIEQCSDPQLKERAYYIIDAIKKDIENDAAIWSYAKYKTLMRHITSPKFEAACAAN